MISYNIIKENSEDGIRDKFLIKMESIYNYFDLIPSELIKIIYQYF